MAAINRQEEILAQLDRIKNNKKRQDYFQPKEYKEFMPATMGYEPRDKTLAFRSLDNIRKQGEDATQLSEIIAQGERDRQEMIRRRRELERARRGYSQAQRSQPSFNPQYSGGGSIPAGTVRKWDTNRWGEDGIPEVSDLGRINAQGAIVNVKWRGHNVAVNKQVAPIFIAFLDDLYKMGYRPATIGGHVDRNIAGTNTTSLHSYGLAIDIDPGRNPIYYNSPQHQPHSLPPGIGALAAKYGLAWGGNWRNTKDYMHFSVPYGGTQ